MIYERTQHTLMTIGFESTHKPTAIAMNHDVNIIIFRTGNLKFLILRIQNCYCIIHAKSVQTFRANRSMRPVTSRRVNFLSAIPNLENQNHLMKSGAWQHHLLTSTWTFTLGPLRRGVGDGPGVMFCTFKTRHTKIEIAWCDFQNNKIGKLFKIIKFKTCTFGMMGVQATGQGSAE